MKFPILLLAALSLTGCAKFLDKFSRLEGGGTTMVQFDAGQRGVLPAAVSGGLIIYAVEANGARIALKLNSDTDNTAFPLPNGTYTFKTIGFMSAGMTGLIKCGSNTGGPVTLAGQPVTVNLSVDSPTCATPTFTAAAYQNAGTIGAPNMIFCGATVNVSTKAYANNCASGEESVRFLRPNVTSATLLDRFDYDSETDRVLYVGDPYAGTRQELFSVNTDGTDVVRESTVQPSIGREIDNIEVVKDKATGEGTGQVIYTSDAVTNGLFEMYISDIGDPGAIGAAKGTNISGAIVGGGQGVKAFKLTPDGSKAVFIGSMDVTGINEVYMVDLTTFTRTKLSSPPGGGGVGSTGNFESQFAISPDGNYAVFAGQYNSTTGELFSVPLTAPHTVRQISTNSPLASSSIHNLAINFDGTKVVWQADSAVTSEVETFASVIYPVTPDPKNVSGALSYTGTAGNRIELAPDADIVAFTKTQSAANRFDLYLADFSNLASIVTELAFDNLEGGLNISSNQIHDMQFVKSGANRRLVFLADATTPGKYELFSKPVAFPASAVLKVSHTATFNSGIAPSGPGVESNMKVLDYNKAYYLADNTTDSELRLYEADLGVAGAATIVGQNSATDGSNSLAVGYGQVFYNFSAANVSPFLPYLFTPGSTYSALPLGPFDTITRMLVPPADEIIPGYPSVLFMQGKGTGSGTVEDYFMLEDYSSSAPVKVSHVWGGTTGEGRVMIHLLTYHSNGSPSLGNVSEGISSGCITPPATDGSPTSHAFALPYGAGDSSSPFAVAIDVFPNSTSCTGDYDRIIFPYGLANPAASDDPTKVKLTSSSGNVRFFLRD